MDDVIKQEIFDHKLWEGPLRGPVPNVPEAIPGLTMTLLEYEEKVENAQSLPQIDIEDIDLCRVVWIEIRKLPELWKNKNKWECKKLYPKVAVEVYSRTGCVLLCSEIIKIFQNLRSHLRNKLMYALLHEKILNIEDLENELWKWEDYPFARFLRFVTHRWELKTRQRMLKDPNGKHIVHDIEDENEVDNDGENAQSDIRNDTSTSGSQEKAYANTTNLSHHNNSQNREDFITTIKQEPGLPQTLLHSPELVPMNNTSALNDPFEHEHNSFEDSGIIPQPEREAPSRKRKRVETEQNNERPQQVLQPSLNTLMHDFAIDFDQISNQAMRNLRNEPDRYRELKGALFDLVLRFGNYENLGEMFSDLARRNRGR